MAKILTDVEMAEIIHKAVSDPGLIDCSDSYSLFLEDLGTLIADHFGGERGNIGHPDFTDGWGNLVPAKELGWTCGFHIDESVPDDGGVYKDYDTDITWKDGEELDIV